MADDDEALQFWLSVMGNSDDESDFEGFTVDEINKADESDVDLDIVVNNDQLHANLESTSQSGSDQNPNELSENTNSDADLPTAVGPSVRKRQKRRTKKARDDITTRWSDRTKPVRPTKQFAGFDCDDVKVGVSHDLPVGSSPFEYFSLLLPEEFWNTLSSETNRYAVQRQALKKTTDTNWHETTPQEMKLFIFIQFMFGIHRLPEANMYWSTDPLLRVPAIAEVMSRNRFNKLNQYFHVNDNSKAVPKGEPAYDPLFKVRPLLNTVLENSRAHYYPGKDISIDEAMIKFNGRLSFKQYIKGKTKF